MKPLEWTPVTEVPNIEYIQQMGNRQLGWKTKTFLVEVPHLERTSAYATDWLFDTLRRLFKIWWKPKLKRIGRLYIAMMEKNYRSPLTGCTIFASQCLEAVEIDKWQFRITMAGRFEPKPPDFQI